MVDEKITVLIVEDEPIIAADLTYLLQDFGYNPLPAVRNAADALLMLRNIVPDFILLDVTLEGDQDGIALAEQINKLHNLPIIFLTAHHDRSTIDRIKATLPSAYLVKPINEHNLQTSIELALYNHSHQRLQQKRKAEISDDFVSGKHFFIKVKNQLRKVPLDDILALEAQDNYSYVHTLKHKYLISSTLKTLEQKLSPDTFIRVHRSFMVNIKSIEGIEDDTIILPGLQIPIGKTYRDDFMKRIDLL